MGIVIITWENYHWLVFEPVCFNKVGISTVLKYIYISRKCFTWKLKIFFHLVTSIKVLGFPLFAGAKSKIFQFSSLWFHFLAEVVTLLKLNTFVIASLCAN